ncbi:hypothetical protein [Candidatus Chloroploca sp. Khr17]|uniref:hypothetical protein n=1 Tax=Candidatus Chloroploca sp. Khr17 TaxID=2496869 RepID=UPI00101C0CA4|nr:hypothetical protein [Candidatus Chloroploca sp. Khr17]
MPRVKEMIMIALALVVGVTANLGTNPAAQPIAGQRVEVEDFSSVRAARSQNPTLLDQLEPQDNAEVAGARRRLTDML